jgi:uncharacterized protein (UPF0333 family)
MIFTRRAQSLLEYSVLLAVVLSTILIMQFYVKRGYQGRLKKEADTVGQQYAPGLTTSIITTTSNSSSVTTTADGTTSVVIDPATSTIEKKETVDAFGQE